MREDENYLSKDESKKWLIENKISPSNEIFRKIVKNQNKMIYKYSLYYHGLKTKDFLNSQQISLFFGRSINKLNILSNKRTDLENYQKKLIGNFGENFAKFFLEKKLGVKVYNANLSKKNTKGYDLYFDYKGESYCVNVTARERFERRINHSGNKPDGNDGMNFYTKRQEKTVEEYKKQGFDHVYCFFIFYYHESELLNFYFIKYDDLIQANINLNKSKQKFMVKNIKQQLNFIKINPINQIFDPGINLSNKLFEDLLFSSLDNLSLFKKSNLI